MQIKLSTLFVLTVLFSNLVLAQTTTEEKIWDRKHYQFHFGNFNEDAIRDIFLESKSENKPNHILIGAASEDGTQFNSGNLSDYSSLTVGNYNNSRNLVGDFNGDGFDDLLSLIPFSGEAGVVFGGKNVFKYPHMKAVNVIGTVSFDLTSEKVLYSGDFNGDGVDDVLVVSPKFKGFVIYHSSNNKSLHLEQKDVITFETEYSQELYVDDFNGDGYDDVVAISQDAGKSHYVHIVDNRGRFYDTNLQQFPSKLDGVDWNPKYYSLINWKNDQDNSVDIIRIKNHIGGVDEDGNVLNEMGNKTTLSLEQLNADQCQQIAFSPETGLFEDTCAPWGAESLTQSKGSNAPSAVPTDDDEPPPTPHLPPSISGGSYQPINTTYTVSAYSVPGADDWLHFESTNNVNYSLVGGYGKSFNTSQSSYGYRYYKYKACNINGCSGLSPYNRIFVYSNPSIVNNFYVSPTSIEYGQGVTISWSQSGGLIPSGHYQKVEISPTGVNKYFSNTTQGSGSNFSFSATPSSGAGTYTYKLRACNPNNLCGGWKSKTVSVSILSPSVPSCINAPSTAIVGVNYSVSWCSSSGATRYELQGERSGTLQNNSSTSDTRNKPAGTYYYKVRACNGSTNSSCSAFTPTTSGTVVAPPPTVANPNISPNGGNHTDSVLVTLSRPSGATVYYSTNGATPTTVYSAPFTLTSSKTVKAIAKRSGYNDSNIITASFTVTSTPTVTTPNIFPNGGNHTNSVLVTLSRPSGATVYYSTNGATPTTVYSAPFTLTSSKTVKAIAKQSGYNDSGIRTASFTVTATPTVTTPNISPNGGNHTNSVLVTLSRPSGASVYYSTNGATPTTVYSAPFTLTSSKTVKAIAKRSGYNDSNIITASFTVTSTPTVTTPNISPNGGNHTNSVLVTLSRPSGATVYYSTNGATPTTVYSAPFTLTSSKTVKAIAKQSGYNDSGIRTASFTVTATPTVTTPNISPNGGNHTNSVLVTLSRSSGATVYYSTNGATPTTVYSAPFTLTSSKTVKAIAKQSGYNDSGIRTASFTVTAINSRRVIFIHTDLLGSPAAETDANGDVL
jgi:AraC-like DNA-binding protein